MIRTSTFFAALLLVLASAAIAGETTLTLSPDNQSVVIVNPPNAPVSIDTFDGKVVNDQLQISFALANRTDGAIHRPGVAIMMFDGERVPVGAATYRTCVEIEPGRSRVMEAELPAPKGFNAQSRLMVVPIAASTATASWQVPPERISPLVHRARSSDWGAFQHAVATEADLRPLGETVQLLPPKNCSLLQCAQNWTECNSFCAFQDLSDTCAYCDRRSTDEGCTTICFCVGFVINSNGTVTDYRPCPPPPDGWM